MERFEGIKALVIGDVMIDTYTTGVVERMSPEAPVPILNVQERFDRLGGAANVALNMKALGAEPILCSIIGDDSAGKMLIQMMQDHDMNVSGLVSSHRRKTTLKHRILNDGRQMMRIDEEDTFDLSEMEYAILSHVVKQLMELENIQVVVLQDYNKGVLTEQMIHRIVEMAHEKSIPVVVDPKKKNFFAYRGVTLFKPNGKELRDGLGVHAETIDELRQAAQQLQERLQCQHLMVTLSEQGAMILSRDDGERGPAFVHVPACPRNIVDVSGAGDTVLSVAALCTAKGQDPETIVSLSNIAGGLVCEEVGVVPIDRKRFEEEVQRLCHD
ncbi:MAG: hypothetical protein K6A28_07105 [Bacteroidales bacterium]|nr:hypothetical protein [Bacteroidales bacterium]